MMDRRSTLAPFVIPSSTNVHPSSSGSGGGAGASGAGAGETFDGRTDFQREQDRLVGEIANGFEELMADANGLNRRMEEVLGVGAGVESVAALWGKFGEIMRAGLPDAVESVANSTVSSDTSLAWAGGPGQQQQQQR